TGSGRVVIWMVLPMILDKTNMSIPIWSGQFRRVLRLQLAAHLEVPYLPSSPFIWGPALIVRTLFVFKYMRFSLEREPNRLETGRYQPDNHAHLPFVISSL